MCVCLSRLYKGSAGIKSVTLGQEMFAMCVAAWTVYVFSKGCLSTGEGHMPAFASYGQWPLMAIVPSCLEINPPSFLGAPGRGSQVIVCL